MTTAENQIPARGSHFSGIISQDPSMQEVFSLIQKVAPSHINVLITGESGTGKELVAAAVHERSPRKSKAFVAINCAAIPQELLESELFGHAKGAFTGATNSRRGLFEEANGGTVLLDEVGDLPLPLQAKILRLLQTREIKVLGQNEIKKVDVRVLSATHKDLRLAIKEGFFREDLYYRLNVMPIHLPPLRRRKSDIPLLANHFLQILRSGSGSGPRRFTREAMQRLLVYDWRGNIRELENVVKRATVLANGAFVEASDIVLEPAVAPSTDVQNLFDSDLTLKDLEREYIRHVLAKTENRKEAATRILGIDRKTLYRKEKQYGLRTGL